jgi:HK97 family phage major capsid protein
MTTAFTITNPRTTDFISKMEEAQKKLHDRVVDKINNPNIKEEITESEIANYVLTDEDQKIFDSFKRFTDGETIPGFSFTDFLGTPQAKILIPQVLIGKMRRAAEPEYLASKFYKTITVKGDTYTVFPSIGAMRAHDLAEGQEYPVEGLGTQEHEKNFHTIQKVGLRIEYSDELLKDAEWGIVSILNEEAGKAMARHKEQKIYNEWLKYGWTVFDNGLRAERPDAGTTGVDFNNQLNDTLSVEDFLDLIIAVMNNEHTPTDLFMHPLVWPAMAKQGLVGSWGKSPETPNASFQLGPNSLQGRLPFAFTVNLSPFMSIDKTNKTYNMCCIDKNNIGAILQREKMTVDSFTDPRVDIHNTKYRERYSIATNDQGRGISVAKNLSLAKSYAIADRVVEVEKPTHL